MNINTAQVGLLGHAMRRVPIPWNAAPTGAYEGWGAGRSSGPGALYGRGLSEGDTLTGRALPPVPLAGWEW
jgi:hypothetical protein